MVNSSNPWQGILTRIVRSSGVSATKVYKTLTSLVEGWEEDFNVAEPDLALVEEWLDCICSPARGTTIYTSKQF